MTEPTTYLERVETRRIAERLRKQVIFGLGFGLILLVVGSVEYFLVPNANDTLWFVAMIAGGVLLGATLLAPALIDPVERAWMWAAGKVGHLVFSTVLALIYFVVILPVGLLLQRRGRAPYYEWENDKPTGMEGWVPKELTIEEREERRSRSIVTQLTGLVRYFSRRGAYVYLPVLTILIALGLLMFFAQTSALAPFIYTLF